MNSLTAYPASSTLTLNEQVSRRIYIVRYRAARVCAVSLPARIEGCVGHLQSRSLFSSRSVSTLWPLSRLDITGARHPAHGLANNLGIIRFGEEQTALRYSNVPC